MNQDDKLTHEKPGLGHSTVEAAEAKRVAARRRFLRVGGGGSAALVLTVVHKRSFAGMKKGVIASQCTSLRGVADLTGAKHKKPLEMSAMGTPKNMICRPPDKDPNPVGNCTEIYPSRYVDKQGKIYLVADGDQINKGCGNLQLTIDRSRNYRLYGKADKASEAGYGKGGDGGGYCPVAYDGMGDLNYQPNMYYKRVDKKGGGYDVVLVDSKDPFCKPTPF